MSTDIFDTIPAEEGAQTDQAMKVLDATWRSHGESDFFLRAADILLRYGLTPLRYAGR